LKSKISRSILESITQNEINVILGKVKKKFPRKEKITKITIENNLGNDKMERERGFVHCILLFKDRCFCEYRVGKKMVEWAAYVLLIFKR